MQPIQRVAVVGAGNMGSGIAQKSAQEEFDVQMVDRELQWVERGQSIIANFLDEAVERRIFSPAQVEAIQGRITGVVGVENTAENTDLVIEAVFGTLTSKPPCSTHWTRLAVRTPSLRPTPLHCRSTRSQKPPVEPTVSLVCISSITPPRTDLLR